MAQIISKTKIFAKKYLPQILALLVLSVGVVYAAWTSPSGTPPDNNTPAPINVGLDTQVKTGILGVLGLVTNAFTMPTGAQNGYVLTSDAAGNTTWAAHGHWEGLSTSDTNAFNPNCEYKFQIDASSIGYPTNTIVYAGLVLGSRANGADACSNFHLYATNKSQVQWWSPNAGGCSGGSGTMPVIKLWQKCD